MPYVTQQQLVDRFGADELIQITNRTDPTATAVNATRLADAIADAEALITARLSVRYTMPLASVPLLLRNLACDMVRARLYDDRLPDAIAKREETALKLLADIAQGKLSLGIDEAAQPTAVVDGPSSFSGCPVFTADSLRDYAP